MRLWYLSHRRPEKSRASLRIRAVSPDPLLFTHMKYGSRWSAWPKIRYLAPLDGCTCMFEEWVREDEKCHNLVTRINCYALIANFEYLTSEFLCKNSAWIHNKLLYSHFGNVFFEVMDIRKFALYKNKLWPLEIICSNNTQLTLLFKDWLSS